jgi:hypothetical protein
VGEVPFEPWVEGAGGSFQWEEVPILVGPGKMVVKVEEALVGGVEGQVYSTEVGGGWAVLAELVVVRMVQEGEDLVEGDREVEG